MSAESHKNLKTATFADAAPSAPTPLGKVRYFGDYELLREIARGGMGVVFEARQVSLNRIVALKMILKGELASAADVQRFRQEARAAANLDHPNIVPIFEVGEQDGQHYFSMKFIECGPGNAACTAREKVSRLATVARAVHHAHQRGILHRDLKPSNILIDAAGEAHVADFGLAKRLTSPEAGDNATRSGAIVGTPAYMAPEQAGAEKSLTTAADVWSLGAVLYDWLTGRPPFRGDDPLSTLMKVVNDEPAPPSSLDPSIDRDLETICLKCLEKDPAKRYASAEAVATDLDHWLRGEPIAARRAGRVERVAKWARRRPAVASLLMGLLVVTIGGLAGVLWNWREAVSARSLADDRARDEAKARGDEAKARQEAEKERRKAEIASAGLALDRGISLAEAGEVSRGMLWMARALRQIPRDTPDLERAIRANLHAWSLQDHALQYRLAAAHDVFEAICFLPDNQSFVTSASLREFRRIDVVTGERIGAPWEVASLDRCVCLKASEDGKTVLTCHQSGNQRTSVLLWDVGTGKPARAETTFDNPSLLCGDVTRDLQRIVAGGYDRTAKIWNTATGELLHTLQHAEPPFEGVSLTPQGIHSVAYSPDNKTIATASQSGWVRFWDADTGKERGPILKHDMPVRAVAFHPDGATVVTACEDQRAYFWDVKTGSKKDTLRHHGRVTSAAFTRDGAKLVTASTDYNVRVWDLATRKTIAQPLRQRGWINSATISPDGSTVLIPFRGDLWVWKTPAAKTVHFPHRNGCRALTFSGDGKRLLIAASDKTARLWDAETGQALGPPLVHEHRVHAALFEADEKTVLTASADGVIGAWDPVTGKRVGAVTKIDVPFENGLPFLMLFHPDRKRIMVGGFHDRAVFFDVTTGKKLKDVPFAGTYLVNAAIAPNGRTFLTGSWSKFHSTHLWIPGEEPAQPRFPENPERVHAPISHNGAVSAVIFSPDSKRYLLGTYGENAARLYDAETNRPIGPTIEDTTGIYDAAIAPDGVTVLIGTLSREGHGRFWDALAGKSLGPALHIPWGVNVVAFTPDGRRAALGRGGYGLENATDPAVLLVDSPQPLRGDPEQIERWVEYRTRFRLGVDGTVTLLDGPEIDRLKVELAKHPTPAP